jgi:hypothetical protein
MRAGYPGPGAQNRFPPVLGITPQARPHVLTGAEVYDPAR